MYNGPMTGGTAGVGMGALAATGSDLVWWIFLGLAMLVTGLLTLHVAQRRLRVKLEPKQRDS
ncbi:MAG TPA: peptidase [Actinophytocola sp.]|jgi:hypothetical protein|uniref:peptidase n=1 Tax=Actinophytocola sp. TaxID=1872138 RepID=UPI002E0361AA|nr:peptidase [Actinophytocola sp.]